MVKNSIPAVSVIIPAYNAENKIARCIASIENQSFRNLEVIVIDDGSTDSTCAVVKKIAEADERIRIIRQKNCGQAVARKRGVMESRGKYIVFIDSDDYVLENHVENMYKSAMESECDIVRTAYTKKEGDKLIVCKKPKNDIVLTKSEALDIMSRTYDFATPVAQIVKKDLFDDEVFDGVSNIKYAEDYLMNLRLLMKAKHVYWCGISSYIYDIDNDSTSMNSDLTKQISNAKDALVVYSSLSSIVDERLVAYRMFHAAMAQMKRIDFRNISYDTFLRQFELFITNELYLKHINNAHIRDFSKIDRLLVGNLKRKRYKKFFIVLKMYKNIKRIIR